MTSHLEQLFNIVRDAFTELRSLHGNTFDGQTSWQPIKNVLKTYDSAPGVHGWKLINKKAVKSIMSLPEFMINGYGEKHIIEENHFLIQQVRIPSTEECTLRKIIQLALNIGQYEGYTQGRSSRYSDYASLKLTKVSRYVNKKDIKHFQSIITPEIIHTINTYLSTLG